MRYCLLGALLAGALCGVQGCRTPGDPVVIQGALDGSANLGSIGEYPGPRSAKQILEIKALVASNQALIKLLGAPR